MLEFTYLGWSRFSNTGHHYRRWQINTDVRELEACEGDDLVDLGPAKPDGHRFDVTTDGASKGRQFSLEEVEAALGATLPVWSPPTELDRSVLDSMQSVCKALADLSQSIRATPDAGARLEAIKRIASNSGEAPTSAEGNQYLRLKGAHHSRSGSAFKDWELLADVPEIRVTQLGDARPMHAVAGDVLREGADDDLELRRDEKRIGDLEWWQVRYLFIGLREDCALDARDKPLDFLRRLVPHPPEDYTTNGPYKRTNAHELAFRATADIPGTPIRSGDVILYLPYKRTPAGLRGQQQRVPRSVLGVVAGHLDSLIVLERAVRGDSGTTPEDVRARLMQPQRAGWQDKTSPLLVVRPLVSPVSEPIQAGTDDAALFELMCQAGGRMPQVEDS